MSETILLSTEDNIGYITLNRPDVHQAFNGTMISEIQSAFETFANDQKVRVIVLQSSGKTFCAGADLNYMKEMIEYSEQDNFHDAKKLAEMFYAVYSCPKPTIAKVHGNAFGGGVGLICACDIAISSQSAMFCLSEVKLGLVPAVISPYVIQALGNRNSKYWMLSAKKFSAREAKASGLVQETYELNVLNKAVADLAKDLCNLGPQAMRTIKTIYKQSYDEIQHTQDYYCQMIAKLRISEEGQEGLKAFLDKRKPNWS